MQVDVWLVLYVWVYIYNYFFSHFLFLKTSHPGDGYPLSPTLSPRSTPICITDRPNVRLRVLARAFKNNQIFDAADVKTYKKSDETGLCLSDKTSSIVWFASVHVCMWRYTRGGGGGGGRIVQDLAVVPLLVAIPLLAGGGGGVAAALTSAATKAAIALGLIAFIGTEEVALC